MDAGLCDGCANQKVVTSQKGTTFSFCELSKWDLRFPKYPRIPVLNCAGFEAERAEALAQRERKG